MQDHDSSPLSDYIEYPSEEMLQRSADFYENIKRRHSIRSFSDRPVAKAVSYTHLTLPTNREV